jgi:hypothetical protein
VDFARQLPSTWLMLDRWGAAGREVVGSSVMGLWVAIVCCGWDLVGCEHCFGHGGARCMDCLSGPDLGMGGWVGGIL